MVSTLPRLMQVCCHNNKTTNALLSSMRYKVYGQCLSRYLVLNIWTKEGSATSKQTGVLLYPEDLEVMALIPTTDAVEAYVALIHEEAAERFAQAKKD